MGHREPGRLPIFVDVGGLTGGLEDVDLLARFQLLARRYGYRIVLEHPCRELVELIELAGLSRELPVAAVSSPDAEAGRTAGTDDQC